MFFLFFTFFFPHLVSPSLFVSIYSLLFFGESVCVGVLPLTSSFSTRSRNILLARFIVIFFFYIFCVFFFWLLLVFSFFSVWEKRKERGDAPWNADGRSRARYQSFFNPRSGSRRPLSLRVYFIFSSLVVGVFLDVNSFAVTIRRRSLPPRERSSSPRSSVSVRNRSSEPTPPRGDATVPETDPRQEARTVFARPCESLRVQNVAKRAHQEKQRATTTYIRRLSMEAARADARGPRYLVPLLTIRSISLGITH